MGRRFSLNCCTFQPPATISHAPGFIVRAASRMRASASDERRRADPVHLGAEAERRANRVQVRVDEAGDDRSALQIDDASLRARELANVRRAADGRDLAVADRERFAVENWPSTVRILPLTSTVSATLRAGRRRRRRPRQGRTRQAHTTSSWHQIPSGVWPGRINCAGSTRPFGLSIVATRAPGVRLHGQIRGRSASTSFSTRGASGCSARSATSVAPRAAVRAGCGEVPQSMKYGISRSSSTTVGSV